MGQIIPAVVGGVILVLGLIYWKKIKPAMDAKKAAKAKEVEAKIKEAERKAWKAFVLDRILPKVPVNGAIPFTALLSLLEKEDVAAGGAVDMSLLKASLTFGTDPKTGYLARNDNREIILARKGMEIRTSKK